jgi:2-C-methyl-D-erythritol 4-phosphate cytidylyltransferase
LKKYIVIVAGGTGTRMKSEVPKQFIELLGTPILMHTINRFTSTFPAINVILVLSPDFIEHWEALCDKHNFTIPHQQSLGGATRFHSVQNGLMLVPDDSLVGIHDAARPLVSDQTIKLAFDKAAEKGNASPAIALHESIRLVENDANKAVDRSKYYTIQTPQCFQSSLIKKAFTQEFELTFTDDASVLEATGESINLVDGNIENIKITTPQDLLIANAIMNK